MKANAWPLLAIFEQKLRLEVPLFQRQYVWGRDQQWEPLWEDIARKFTDYLEGRKDAPVHFLGAMVLDQKQTPQDALYEEYWKPFDDPFWRVQVSQGRLNRPRSDLFL